MKVGQSRWVDRTFGNAVVSGMYSFHASAAAYTDYWNNAFGQVNLDYMAPLSRKHIWQTFIQESTRVIAANQDCNLTLSESLPIDAVTRAAFNLLAVLYSAPPIPAGILQESIHSSGIPVESSHSCGIPLDSSGIPQEFHRIPQEFLVFAGPVYRTENTHRTELD
jgi:hypothetical protein